MTDAEWQACECPLPMLIYLRGEVPYELQRARRRVMMSGHGDLFAGPGQRISADQCRRFILWCADRLCELPVDEPSHQALTAYRRHVLEGAPREDFFRACQRIQIVLSAGGSVLVSHMADYFWTDDPLGAASAASDIASAIANERAKESVAVTCAAAAEDDWWIWGFCGGPPDPLWQAVRADEERFQAGALRAIVGNPFRRAV